MRSLIYRIYGAVVQRSKGVCLHTRGPELEFPLGQRLFEVKYRYNTMQSMNDGAKACTGENVEKSPLLCSWARHITLIALVVRMGR